MTLAHDISFAGLPLRVERIEYLLEALVGRCRSRSGWWTRLAQDQPSPWPALALEVEAGCRCLSLDPIVMSIQAKLRRAGKGKRLVIENGAEAEVNASLVELIKEAFAIRNQLLSGSDDSIEAMSGRLGMNKCQLTSLNPHDWKEQCRFLGFAA